MWWMFNLAGVVLMTSALAAISASLDSLVSTAPVAPPVSPLSTGDNRDGWLWDAGGAAAAYEKAVAAIEAEADYAATTAFRQVTLRLIINLGIAFMALFFVLLPLFERGWHASLLVPILSIIYAPVSLEGASRIALLGAFLAGVIIVCKRLMADHARCTVTLPSGPALFLAFAIGIAPAITLVCIGLQIGTWVDGLVDRLIARAEATTNAAILDASATVRAGAHELKGAWYDPREIFFKRPLRTAVGTYSQPATNAATTVSTLAYSLVRALLQAFRFVSLLFTGWVVARLVLLTFFKSCLYAGGTVEFDFSPAAESLG